MKHSPEPDRDRSPVAAAWVTDERLNCRASSRFPSRCGQGRPALRFLHLRFALWFALLWLCALAPPASAITRTVTTLNDSGAGSLRDTIIASLSGDAINFSVTGTITLTSGELLIGRHLTITGPGPANLVVSGNHASRVFNISGGVTVSISGLTVSDGQNSGPNGADVHAYCNGPFGNHDPPTAGGSGAGGGVLNNGTLAVSNCVFVGNVAVGGLGGNGDAYVSCAGNVYFASEDGRPGGNGDGGAIFNGGNLTLAGCTFRSNSALGNTGGIGGNNNGGGPRPGGGGGNAAGGAVYNLGTVSMSGCTFSDNTARGGIGGGGGPATFGIASSGNGGNGGSGAGGAIYNGAIASALNYCTFAGNTASGGDGGSYGCTSSPYPGHGGDGGNGYGGAIEINTSASCVMNSCTISGNSSVGGHGYSGICGGGGPGSGGSLGSDGANGQGLGGGVHISAGQGKIGNTIVSGNAGTAPDVSGTFDSKGYDLIGKTDGSTGWVATDFTGSIATPLDPWLGPLQDNGGPTPTRLPQSGSAAIDNGNRNVLDTFNFDQRGLPRPVDLAAYPNASGGDASDIGAVEVQAPPTADLDIGLRVFDGTATIKIACESPATSPLRIFKNGSIYGILLVATNSPDASKFRVKTSSGVKAWQKLP